MQDVARNHLLIIDPQNDFCDIAERDLPPDTLRPGARLGPALPVPGADADMRRLAAFLRRTGGRLGAIHVTLDSHHPLHIANPGWWIGADGKAPQPFTPVSAADVRSGRWRARNPAAQPHTLAYVEKLEASARYTLVIWPEHCLIGHWGHNVHPAVAAELDAWERERLAPVDYVMKGSNPGTEHYSAARAEVPDPSDPGTLLNRRLVNQLEGAESVVIAGEALSHCVANTVRDVADAMGDAGVRKLVLLRDCTSSVAGFEALGKAFLRDMTARGMRLVASAEFTPS